jgi:hypothetical protein
VLEWLEAESQTVWERTNDVIAWLQRLRSQVGKLAKRPARNDNLPHADEVWDWVDELVKDSMEAIKHDKSA